MDENRNTTELLSLTKIEEKLLGQFLGIKASTFGSQNNIEIKIERTE